MSKDSSQIDEAFNISNEKESGIVKINNKYVRQLILTSIPLTVKKSPFVAIVDEIECRSMVTMGIYFQESSEIHGVLAQTIANNRLSRIDNENSRTGKKSHSPMNDASIESFRSLKDDTASFEMRAQITLSSSSKDEIIRETSRIQRLIDDEMDLQVVDGDPKQYLNRIIDDMNENTSEKQLEINALGLAAMVLPVHPDNVSSLEEQD